MLGSHLEVHMSRMVSACVQSTWTSTNLDCLPETPCWFSDNLSSRLLTLLLPLQISFESIKEKSIVWYGEPEEDFLFLLSSNASILEQEIQEVALLVLK